MQIDRADGLAGLIEQRDRRLALGRHPQHEPWPALRIVERELGRALLGPEVAALVAK